MVENTKDFIYYFQIFTFHRFKYLSPSGENFFEKDSNEEAHLNPQIPFRDIHPEDFELLCMKTRGEVDYSQPILQRWKDKNGKDWTFEEYATPIYESGKLVALQGVLRNIDDKIKLQETLRYRLDHDGLTNLYNREYFEQLKTEYDEKKDIPIAIMVCDLDDLKYINDCFGHKRGDDLIKSAAALLDRFSS